MQRALCLDYREVSVPPHRPSESVCSEWGVPALGLYSLHVRPVSACIRVVAAKLRPRTVCEPPQCSTIFVIMGKHGSPTGLDNMEKWGSGSLTPLQAHARPVRDRLRRRQHGLDLAAGSRVLQWKSGQRSAVETLGRKRPLSDTNLNLNAMDRARK